MSARGTEPESLAVGLAKRAGALDGRARYPATMSDDTNSFCAVDDVEAHWSGGGRGVRKSRRWPCPWIR